MKNVFEQSCSLIHFAPVAVTVCCLLWNVAGAGGQSVEREESGVSSGECSVESVTWGLSVECKVKSVKCGV